MGEIEDPTQSWAEYEGDNRRRRVENPDDSLGRTKVGQIPREVDEQGERELLKKGCCEESAEVWAEPVDRHANRSR